MWRYIYLAILPSLLVWFQACAEKPAAKTLGDSKLNSDCPTSPGQTNNGGSVAAGSNSGTSNGSMPGCTDNATTIPGVNNPGTSSNNSTDLCTVMQADSYMKSRFSAFLDALCGNSGATLSLLRSEQYAYKGNGTPMLKIDAKVSTVTRSDGLERSEMQAYGAFLTPATPQSYFELMQMKIDTPDTFKSTYPAETLPSAESVKYTRISGSVGSGVRYKYFSQPSNLDAEAVEYEATAKFLTLVPGQTYVVTNEFELKHNMVDGTRGLSIIHLKSPGVTEVISVSDQIFENGGDHDAALTDAKKSLERDLNFSYRQALYKHENLDK